MEHVKAGFTYTIETVKDGQVIDTETVHNLIPFEGLDYMINVALRGGAQFPAFYVGLFEGAYTPVPTDTMAQFPVTADECTAYAETARPLLVLPAPTDGVVVNSASKAVFTGTADGTRVSGGFVSSSSAKGSAVGVLVSAVRFPSPRPLDAGTILRVTCGFSIIST